MEMETNGVKVMKRASYREAIDWVAQNDSAGDIDAFAPEKVQELVSAVLVADIFDVPSHKVGVDIVKRRQKLFPDCAPNAAREY
jgi:hypothetical protein